MKNKYKLVIQLLILASVCRTGIVLAQSLAVEPMADVAAHAKSSICTLIDPQVFSQDTANQVLAVLNKNQATMSVDFSVAEQEIQDVLAPLIGIGIMSQFVVPAAIWSAASATDQSAFEATFLKFIVSLYSSPLKNFNHQSIQVYPSRLNWKVQSRLQINSVIHNPAAGPSADIPISFILQKNECSWLFIDFVVDNISALANIQAQIQSILQNLTNPNLAALTAVIAKHNAVTA